jgi:hypothetical protein
MRLGIGGGAFGIRGGISTRGMGVGVGPFSAGTSWRGGRRRGSSAGNGSFIVFLLGVSALIWPWWLGSFIAVAFGAENPSAARSITGWVFEALWIVGLIAWMVAADKKRMQRADEEAQREAQLVASRAVFSKRHGNSLVYRHGYCTINHRSPETAERCNKG